MASRGGWWAALAALAVLLCAQAASAETYRDEERGFSLVAPGGFRQIPVAAEEKFIVARWQSEKAFVDKEGYAQRADLKVILFAKGAKASAVVEEGDGGTTIRVENPYKDYKDYLKSDGQGGRYVSKEEEIKVEGVPTTWYEVKYEKLTVPRRAICWVFHADQVDYAVQFEVLESEWDRMAGSFKSCLKTFRLIPRKASVAKETTPGGAGLLKTPDKDLTPQERAEKRRQRFERDLQKVVDRLPKGWKVKRSEHFVAISHADDKFTSKVLDQAEAVRDWLDENYGWVGEGIVAPRVLRVCADAAEERAFTDTSNRSGWVQEITVSRDSGAFEFRWVNSRVNDAWWDDRAPEVERAMPSWLRSGLGAYVSNAYAKGGKLDFVPDVWAVQSLREAARAKKLPTARQFLVTPRDMQSYDPGASAFGDTLFRFLVGPGARMARTKDLLRRYMEGCVERAKEAEKAFEASAPAEPEPQTEEEEEKRFRERKDRWSQFADGMKAKEKETLDALFQKAFSSWGEDDWKAFEGALAKFMG